MANDVGAQTHGRGSVFWTLVGVGILALLLAAGWRVATGAALEAQGKEWSIKVTEAANTLDEARKQLEQQAKQFQEELGKREKYWAEQVAAIKEKCPKAFAAFSSEAPPKPVAPAVREKALAEVAKTTQAARNAAKDLSRIKVPLF